MLRELGLATRSLELCAGSAHWSTGMNNIGLDTEKHDIVHSSGHDLRSVSYVHAIQAGAVAGQWCICHIGVCCTTFSRAANPPYRSSTSGRFEDIFLLPGMLQKKVQKALDANTMADHACSIALTMAGRGALCSIENPTTSMLWIYYERCY